MDESPTPDEHVELLDVEAGGRTIVLRLHVAAAADAVAIVLPALGVPARWYDGLASRLAASGRHAVTVEFPGQGDSPVTIDRTTRIGYQALLDVELEAALAAAADRWPDLPVVLVGHSLGGQLAMLHAASNPADVRGVALPAAGTIHWRAQPGLGGPLVLAGTQFARAVATIRGVYPGDRLGFGGRQPATLIRDWAHAGLTGRWEPAGAEVDHHERLARLDLPVLSVVMEGDLFAPPSAAAALVGLAPNAAVTMRTAPTSASGRQAHFAWLRAPEPVVAHFDHWLGAILA